MSLHSGLYDETPKVMCDSCFLQLDIKKFGGTEKLRTALQEPEGSCVMAAQASGGSVFNMNKWLPSKEVSLAPSG